MTADEFLPEDNLAIAQRRAERLTEHGPTVVGISQQAGIAGLSLMWLLIAVPSALDGDSHIWFALLAGLGSAVTLASWIIARRQHNLQVFIMDDLEDPMKALNPTQRKAIAMQLRGRVPVPLESVPLVRAMLLWQRRASRAVWPTLAGMGVGLIGLGGTLANGGFPWLLLLEFGAVVFVTIVGVVESHRRDRVLAKVANVDTPNRTSC